MSEIQNFEDHEDSMEPGELKVTPPGTPILNSEGANEEKQKAEDGNEKYENAKSLSSLDILKTYKDQEDDRYIPVQDISGNSFYDGNYPPNHPGQMIMQSRGFPLYRGGGRGVNIKARLGFRGNHRGAFFQGRGRGFSQKRNSNEIRDFQEVKKPFKIKLMYTKTKPSLSWHPNPNYIGPQKLDLSKNKSLDSSKTESKKHDDKIDDKSLNCNKFEKDSSKNIDKKSSSRTVDKKKIKESKSKKDKDKKESKKKSYSSSKERSKNDKKREKEKTKLSSKKGSKKKDFEDRQSEKCEKKSIEGDKIKERKSKSSDRSHNSSKTRETEERKRYSRHKNNSKSSKSPDRKRKTRFDKSPEKLINKRNKSLERASSFKEISKDDKKIATNKECSTSKKLDDHKSKEKSLTEPKTSIESEKQDKCKKEKELKNIENKEITKKEKEKGKCNSFDMFKENSPNTPEPLESTTPVLQNIQSIVLTPNSSKNDFKTGKKSKKEKDNTKRNRTSSIDASSLSFVNELYEEELENNFPLTKDGSIQAVESKKKQKQNKTEKLKNNKTDELDTNSSPDTEDYQDMWEEDDELLPSSQSSEQNRPENRSSIKQKTHEEILKNIKVEMDDELEIIKRNQDVIENEIFKNLGTNSELIKIKQERISMDELVIIKREKNSDESSNSSDDSEDDEDSGSTSDSSSSSNTSSSSSSHSSTSESDVSSNRGKSSKSDDEIKDGFSTPLFVNPSPPPELATSLNVKDIPPPLKMFCPPSENKLTSNDKLNEDSIAIQNSIEEIMEQNEMNFNQRKDSKKSPAYCKSKQVPSANLKTQTFVNNSSLDTSLNNQNKEPNEKGESGSNQKFVIAMQDIYEQFLQSVTSAGVDLSCENEAKSPRPNVNDFNKEKPTDDQSNTTRDSEYLELEVDNKKDFKNEKESASGKKVESHTIQKFQPIKMDLPKPKKIHNIIPLDEIGASHLTNRDLQTELNSLKLSELKSPQFDLAISPKTEEPVIMLAPEKIPPKIIEKNSPTNSKNSTDESTSSSSDSDDSDSDETSSISSDSEIENSRSILGVEFETLQKFAPEDRKNLRALEKRLNTLQSWSAVDEDDKEVFKGLKNILEREIELIIRKYIPTTMKSPIKESTMVPIPKESPKEEKALNILKSPITIKQKAMAPSALLVANGIFDLNNESEKVVAPINTILSVSVPFPTIFSIGAEMAKNNAALLKTLALSKNEVPKTKEDSSKNSSKSSSKSLKSDSDFKSRRSKSPSDRSHKSSSKRSTHSPSRKSPTKHSTKDSKRDRSKSPYSRDERRKSSPYHKNLSSASSRRARVDSPSKKQSSRHKHRRSSSVSRVTSRHSRSPGSTTSKRFRARTPTPPRPSKARAYDKLTNKIGQRKSDFHRSRSFSRSRSRSITPREGTTFRGRGRIRNSISPKRRSFSPRRSSISPRRSSISPRRSVNSRRSASPRGRNFSRSPIPFRPPSPSVSPPLSGNDSSRSPKRLRSLSRSRTRSRSLSPHIHKIRRLDDVHHTHWNTDESNSNNQYYAENTYGYATSPSRMAIITNEEPPRRIDTVIGRVMENDSLYQPYGSGSYSGYEYIHTQPSGIPMQHYEFDFNAPSNVLYPHSENSDYYYHQDYQDNRSYSHINQADVVDPLVTNCTKTVAVQKGNVLEIVPSAVLPEDLDSALVKVATKENIKIEKQDELNIEFNVKNEETLFVSTEQKKKKSPSWKREVHRRQMLAAVLKLHRDSDGNMKSILIKQEEKSREKKSVLFADGIKPGSGPMEEKSTVLKKEKRTKKERKEKKKNKIALENKENTNLLELLNVDTNIDPELENAPPPPPPPGSPPPSLDQPIYMRASSPPDFTYFHFDSAVSCMYFSKNPVPIPPRLLNGSFPSPPRSNQINQQNQVQQSQQQQPQQQHHQVQLQHQIQLQGTPQSIQMQIHQQQMFVNPTNQSNVLSSISNASDRLLTQNRKITSPIPVVSSNTFSSSTPTGVRSSLVQRFNTVSNFSPSNISMSSCNFSIPPPNIPPPIIPSQSHGTISTGGAAVSSIQLLQNPRNFIQHNTNVINVQQQSPTLEQIKRATATLPFQSNVQTNNPISITSPIPITSISSNSNNINSSNIINTYNKNNSNNSNNNSNIHNINSNSNSPAFSSDSCFWKKDNTNGNSTVLPSTSSPIALSQPIAIQKIFKNEIVKHINLSPNASLSPGQKKVTDY